ncbi:MAG: hypothetical protein EBV32_04020 [Proteobacteria bacterium]|jgi:hypothetical protein|uniref:Holin n=1 Tax=Candidatus Fonsibacter lacus TaxID=2576439 RepID=A0A964V595_9PROT|nr:hypothetical protein [Candidatus Fonsibacter lacus]NBP60051.1 hypothetical protein [Pseudomonadota bacterium]NCU72293.1 hypothetical protein [Candidatus Fonsibacter lacus]
MKTKLSIFLLSLCSILAPIKPMIIIAVLFIWMDMFFGIWRSVKIGGWKAIRSRRLSNTISKSLLYAGAIVAIYLLEKYVLADILGMFISVDLILTKAFTFFCAFVEIKSVNESYEDITGKNVLKSFKDFLTRTKQDLNEFKP